jgi:hypothetical protein
MGREYSKAKRIREIEEEINYLKNIRPGHPVETSFTGDRSNRLKSMTLTMDERNRIYLRKMKEINDAKELYDFRKERLVKRQMEKTGLCFTKANEAPTTTFYI